MTEQGSNYLRVQILKRYSVWTNKVGFINYVAPVVRYS